MTSEVDEKTLRVAAEHVRFRGRLMEFAKESNRIAGITNAYDNERMFEELDSFLTLEKLTVDNVCGFNEWGELRDRDGMNVWIPGKMAPAGGNYIRRSLETLLSNISNHGNTSNVDVYNCHLCFESAHPFMDGNGRTGRAIWLWQMVNHHNYDLSLGFLHKFYYQSLSQ
jgi:hypothetical protein